MFGKRVLKKAKSDFAEKTEGERTQKIQMVQKRFDDALAAEKKFLASVYEQQKWNLSPWRKIPVGVWESKFERFLALQLEVCPYEPWNTMYLAMDEETLVRTGLALHPQNVNPQHLDIMMKLVDQAYQEFSKAFDPVYQDRVLGENNTRMDDVNLINDVVVKIKGDLHRYATNSAITQVGKEIFMRHQTMFISND